MAHVPHSCKVGTIPSIVIFRYNYSLEIGKVLIVRDAHSGTAWFKVKVDKVNSDGYFFCSKE